MRSVIALAQDARYGARWLFRQPGFTFVAIATLALAIGVNTVIFSIANFLLLRPLPFADVEHLSVLFAVDVARGQDRNGISEPDLIDWRSNLGSFEAIAGYTGVTYTMTGRGDALRVQGRRATANLFDVWGISVAAGRGFEPSDGEPGAPAVALVSNGFWQRSFGANPGIVGERITLDGEPHTIIGVLPKRLELGNLSVIDVWTPTALDATLPRDTRVWQVFGKLKPGVTVDQASAELSAFAGRLAEDHPTTHAGWSARAMPLRAALTGSNTAIILTMLILVVAFVLAIACANIANLMLARGVVRRKELAVRAAIGAGRLRIVRQLLTEGALIGVAGGVIGLVLGEAGLRLIKAVTFEAFFQQVTIDIRVLAFVAVLSFLTPIVFSLLPALQAARLNLAETISEGTGRTSGGRRGRRSRNVLVVAQLSLAATLLILSTLVVRSAIAQSSREMGFDPSRVLTLYIDLSGPRYATPEGRTQFADRMLEQLAAVPGVNAAATTTALPFFDRAGRASFNVDGQPVADPASRPWAQETIVSPDYFRTFDIAMVRGRAFDRRDRADAAPVVIVNEAAAERYWPGLEAVGRRIVMNPSGEVLEVVGVSADIFNGLQINDPIEPAIFLPFAQSPRAQTAYVLQTAGDPAALSEPVRQVFRAADPDQAVFDVRPMAQVFWEELASDRLLVGMFTSFAILALVLASAGLYGLMSYSVAQRTQEFGVRLALGASGRTVIFGVLRSGLGLAAGGLVVGLLGGYALAQAVAHLLYGVGPTDPVSYAAVVGVLLAVALAGSYVPVRRAIAQDPVRALRR